MVETKEEGIIYSRPIVKFAFGPFEAEGNQSTTREILSGDPLWERRFRKIQTISEIDTDYTHAVLLYHEDSGRDVAIIYAKPFPSWSIYTMDTHWIVIIENMTLYEDGYTITQKTPNLLAGHAPMEGVSGNSRAFPIYWRRIDEGISSSIRSCLCGRLRITNTADSHQTCSYCGTNCYIQPENPTNILTEELLVNQYIFKEECPEKMTNIRGITYKAGFLIRAFSLPMGSTFINKDTVWDEFFELCVVHKGLISTRSFYNMKHKPSATLIPRCILTAHPQSPVDIHTGLAINGLMHPDHAGIILEIIKRIGSPLYPSHNESVTISYPQFGRKFLGAYDPEYADKEIEHGFRIFSNSVMKSFHRSYKNIEVSVADCMTIIYPKDCRSTGNFLDDLTWIHTNKTGIKIYMMVNYIVSNSGNPRFWQKSRLKMVWMLEPIVEKDNSGYQSYLCKVSGYLYWDSRSKWLVKFEPKFLFSAELLHRSVVDMDGHITLPLERGGTSLWEFNTDALLDEAAHKKDGFGFISTFVNVCECLGIHTTNLTTCKWFDPKNIHVELDYRAHRIHRIEELTE